MRKVEVDPGLADRAGFTRVDYSDAFATEVDRALPADPRWWRDTLLSDWPRWVELAMSARNAVAAKAGLATGSMLDLPELQGTETETICGLDDKHLDFRLAIHVQPGATAHVLTASTLVRLHGWRGTVYFTPVKPVHRLLVMPSMLRRAARQRTGA